MAFFDGWKDRATDVVQVAGKKVEEAYGATKIKLQIADKQGELRTLYRELGEIVYENAKKNDPDTDAVEDKIAEIEIALEGIAALKGEERELKNQVECPECGEGVDKEANFCPKCGYGMK